MSEIDFAFSGPSGDHFSEWDYDRQCEDEITFAPGQPSFVEQKNLVQRSLNQRVTYNANEKFTFFLVDNLIQVKSFSKSFREVKADFWQSKRLTTGLTTFVATPTLGALAAFGGFPPLAAGALGVGAVAFLIFGACRMCQAHRQVGLWQKNLPEAVAMQRKEAFDTGLLSIYIKDELGAKSQPALFSKVLSTVELNGLYLEYLDALQKEMAGAHNVKSKIALLESVTKNSPLCEKMMNFVRLHPHYGVPLTLYHQEHAKFIKTFNMVENMVGDKVEDVKQKAQENIDSVFQSKQVALSVAYTTYALYKKNAESILDQKMQSYPLGVQYDHYRQTAQNEYRTAIEQAQSIRDTSVRLISFPFDARIDSIRGERDDYIKDIRRNRDAHLLPLFDYISNLHKEAHLVATGAQAPRQYFDSAGLNPQFPTYEMQPIPSAPPLEEILRNERQGYDARVFDEILGIYQREAVNT